MKNIYIKIVFISLICTACYLVILYRTTRSAQRWNTLAEAKQGFEPGVITNGKPPKDVSIEITRPRLAEIQSIKTNSKQSFSVCIKPEECELPPTFVLLRISKDKKPIKEIEFQPTKKGRDCFYYDANVALPGTAGSYAISVNIKYQVYENVNDNLVSRKSYRKTFKWGEFNVKQ